MNPSQGKLLTTLAHLQIQPFDFLKRCTRDALNVAAHAGDGFDHATYLFFALGP